MRRLNVAATARASFYLYNDLEDVEALATSLVKAGSLFGYVPAWAQAQRALSRADPRPLPAPPQQGDARAPHLRRVAQQPAVRRRDRAPAPGRGRRDPGRALRGPGLLHQSGLRVDDDTPAQGEVGAAGAHARRADERHDAGRRRRRQGQGARRPPGAGRGGQVPGADQVRAASLERADGRLQEPRVSSAVLVLDRVTKRFAGHTVVDGLSLSVPRGVIYGLLGPNGAGKTTTIRMIMDIIEPEEGSVRLFGGRGTGREHSARVGYLPEERGLYRRMRVLDLLVFLAEMKGVERRRARARGADWLERLGLGAWRMRRVDELSKGMQQKVQFISTILHEPELVVLDEPFAGLDPVNTQVVKDAVVELRRDGVTILFSTHIMEQAEKLCDQLCIVARGTKLVDGALADIKRTQTGHHLVIGFDGAPGAAAQLFADKRVVQKVDDYGQFAELELAPDADPQRLLAALVSSGARLARFELSEPSLNKIFIDLVGPDAATPEARPQPGGPRA